MIETACFSGSNLLLRGSDYHWDHKIMEKLWETWFLPSDLVFFFLLFTLVPLRLKSNREFPRLPILGAQNPMSCLSAVLVSSHLD